MRALAALIPLALVASPAAAQPKGEIRLPPELTDPAMADKLGRMAGSLTRAMMDLPIGEVEAAVEGREPTGADRNRRVRDLAGRDPNFERRIERQVAASGATMQAGMKALAASMPAILGALETAADEMEREIDRATANLPQPGYPNR